jgi:hypothetical protein
MISRFKRKRINYYFLPTVDVFSISKKLIHRIFIHRSAQGQYKLQLILSVATACLLLATPALSQSKLGPFSEKPRVENPAREPLNLASRPSPAVADIDGDGKDDVIVADNYGANGFFYYYNSSSPSSITFTRLQYWENPFQFISFPTASAPAFSDFDGDGDLDMLVGSSDGTFRYYRRNSVYTNPFTLQTGAWDGATKAGNPLNAVDVGAFATPVFTDLDNDGDNDLIIGSSYLPANKSIHYYINDGSGNFTPGVLTGINPNLDEVSPTVMDVDGDGAKDIVIGAADGNVYFFKRIGATTFEEQTGGANPFATVNKGIISSPAAADFDNDGDQDLVLGAQHVDFDLFYFENKGNGVFEEKISFANPFGGVTVGVDATPHLADIDNDNDLDMIIGNSRNEIKYLRNDAGQFVEVSAHPFVGLTVEDKFTPSFIDIDGDGDKDLVGSAYNYTNTFIEFFRNDGGVYVHQTPLTGFFPTAISADEGHADFADIDNDGDFDFFISDGTSSWTNGDHFFIRFFKNTGTAVTPVFTEMTGSQNPLALVSEEFVLFPRMIDIDHDGDLDAIIGEGGGVVEMSDGNEYSLYENIGTASSPNFRYRGDLLEQGNNPFKPSSTFGDIDNDGDLDIFIGHSGGHVTLYENINQAVVTTLNTQPLNLPLTSGATFIDNLLTLSDSDNDSIVFAAIAIQDFNPGQEELTFTSNELVTGAFNSTSGVLTLRGKAPVSTYQEVLRSIKYVIINESTSGRKKTGPLATTERIISVRVIDADGTNSAAVSRTIQITSGQPPVFSNQSATVLANHAVTINLTTLISDADNNIDLTTLAVVQQPPSSAPTTLNPAGELTVSYVGNSFAGTETVTVRVCDTDASCDESIISITVTNTAPVFADHSLTLAFAAQTTFDVSSLISDAEGNASGSTIQVFAAPSSGASATINGNMLTVNYSGLTFSGTETITLQVCDLSGACDQSTISITVNNAPPVIQPEPVSTPQGSTKVLNLLDITSDPDQNLDLSTIEIISSPTSGASATIERVSENEVNLILDYSGITFIGIDYLTIRACDAAGACTENILAIQVDVESTIEVFNAVAPNSPGGDNKFLRIFHLPAEHKVSIFNRWGDVVYETSHYDNESTRFEGSTSSGKALASGTYFYQIDYVDASNRRQTLTGYLSLKQ